MRFRSGLKMAISAFHPQLLPLCFWTVLEGKHLDPFYLSVIHGTHLPRSLLFQSHWGGTQIRLFWPEALHQGLCV